MIVGRTLVSSVLPGSDEGSVLGTTSVGGRVEIGNSEIGSSELGNNVVEGSSVTTVDAGTVGAARGVVVGSKVVDNAGSAKAGVVEIIVGSTTGVSCVSAGSVAGNSVVGTIGIIVRGSPTGPKISVVAACLGLFSEC